MGGSARVVIEAVAGDGGALQTLARAGTDITAAGTVEEILAVAARTARTAVGAHQAAASRLHDGWRNAHTHVSLSERHAEYGGFSELPDGHGVIGFVTTSNQALRLTADELRSHPEWRNLANAPGHPPLTNYMVAPLIGRDGHNLGLLQLGDRHEGEFTETDEAALAQLAQMTANAIVTLELFDRERAARRRAEALQQVGQAIAARLELQEIVQLATDAATRLTPAAFGAFFYNVLDTSGESYMLYTLSGVPRSAFERFPMPRNTDIFGPTFNGDGIVRFDDVRADPHFGRNAPYHGMPKGHLPVASYLAVPVKTSEGDVVGGMFFGHPEPAMFRSDDEEMVAGIAAQAAIAIENARLYAERSRTAQTLQRALLPTDLPAIEGVELAARYRAAGEGSDVGGDYYDVFPMSDGRWAIVVGDVCGKGPQAATITALARYTLRAHAQSESDPVRLLECLNDALLGNDSSGFCTVAIACLDDRELELVSAGHPPALLVRRDELTTLGAIGTPLGVLPALDLTAVRTTLGDGDVLVLYTDGLTDAAAPQHALTEEDLLDVARRAAPSGPAAVVSALEQRAMEVSAGRPRDDLAILAVQLGPAARREVVRRFPANAAAAAEVKKAVENVAHELGEPLAHDVRLLATELVSNAVRHGQARDGSIELRVALDAELVRLEVLDNGPGFPLPPTLVPAPDGPGGWGLHLVDERAARWGVSDNGMTQIWVELGRP